MHVLRLYYNTDNNGSSCPNEINNTPFSVNLPKPNRPDALTRSIYFKSSWMLSQKLHRFLINERQKLGTRVGASFTVWASLTTAEKPSTSPEITLRPIKEISGTVNLPGFKSLSNRILLLAALSEGTTVVDNLLNSDDVHYMLDVLRTLGLRVEDDTSSKKAIVEGCGGQFPVGIESKEDIQLFLGNAGAAMRPLAVTGSCSNCSCGKSSYVLDGVP